MLSVLLPLGLAVLLAACRADAPRTGAPASQPSGTISWTCNEKDECEVRATFEDGSTLPVFSGVVHSPGTQLLDPTLAEFRMNCGSPCTAFLFVDLRERRVSMPFQDVVAVDLSRRLAAVANVDRLDLVSLFGRSRPVMTVTRNFAPVAALVSAIVSAEFTPDGTLRLRYQRAPDYQEVSEDIPIASLRSAP